MDDDDKIRRNLVVFGAGVLLVGWLDVNVQSVIQDALKLKASVQPWKTWAAALVVQSYLLLRYRFSEDSQHLVNGLSRDYGSVVYGKVSALAQRLGKQGFSQRRNNPVFGGQMIRLREKFEASFPEQAASDWAVLIRHDESTTRWSGKVALNVQMGLVEPRPLSHTYESSYNIPLLHRAPIMLNAVARSWIYSATSVNFLLPVVIGLAALLVVVVKFATALSVG